MQFTKLKKRNNKKKWERRQRNKNRQNQLKKTLKRMNKTTIKIIISK